MGEPCGELVGRISKGIQDRRALRGPRRGPRGQCQKNAQIFENQVSTIAHNAITTATPGT